MKPLTAEEIAELRRLYSVPIATNDDARVFVGGSMMVIAAVLRLLDEVERARALLKRIEWSGEYFYDRDASVSACPSCEGADPSSTEFYSGPRGHRPDCELAALLGETGR